MKKRTVLIVALILVFAVILTGCLAAVKTTKITQMLDAQGNPVNTKIEASEKSFEWTWSPVFQRLIDKVGEILEKVGVSAAKSYLGEE